MEPLPLGLCIFILQNIAGRSLYLLRLLPAYNPMRRPTCMLGQIVFWENRLGSVT